MIFKKLETKIKKAPEGACSLKRNYAILFSA